MFLHPLLVSGFVFIYVNHKKHAQNYRGWFDLRGCGCVSAA